MSVNYDMRVMNELFDISTRVRLDHGDGSFTEHPHRINTYISEMDGKHGYATATLHKDGTVAMTVLGADEASSFQVAPVHHHERYMDSEMFDALSSQHDMVVHTFEGTKPLGHDASRRLLQGFPSIDDRWVGCNGGSETDEFNFKVGVAVDLGYYKMVSRRGNINDNIAQIFATANQVYRPELGVILVVGDTDIKTARTSDSWNQDRGSSRQCANDIDAVLESLNSWRSTTRRSSKMGVWHLLTDCYPPPGTIGLAYMGSICGTNGYNTGVTTHTGTDTWTTVAHELGHNFGADHSFEEGEGSTGGLMDYGDGTLNGIYTFAPRQYREREICGTIQNVRNSPRSYIANCFTKA